MPIREDKYTFATSRDWQSIAAIATCSYRVHSTPQKVYTMTLKSDSKFKGNESKRGRGLRKSFEEDCHSFKETQKTSQKYLSVALPVWIEGTSTDVRTEWNPC